MTEQRREIDTLRAALEERDKRLATLTAFVVRFCDEVEPTTYPSLASVARALLDEERP